MHTNNLTNPRISLATISYLTPPVVDHPGRRKTMHARLHSNLPSKTPQSSKRNLRSLLHTSLYIRFIPKGKHQGARTKTVGTALHYYIRKSPKDGITILTCLYGQLYNGTLAYIYKLAPTDAYPLCGLPDSCTHIAGEARISQQPFHHQTQRSMPALTRSHQNRIQRQWHHLLTT